MRWSAKHVVGIALLGLASLGVALIAALPPVAPPLWELEALPGAPTDSDNGWAVIRDAWAAGTVPGYELDFPVGPEDPEALWAAFAEDHEAVDRLLDSDAGAQARELWADVRARPEFADACPPVTRWQCPEYAMSSLAAYAQAEILRAAHRGRWEGASQLNLDLLRVWSGYAATTRSPFAHQLALEFLADGLETASAIAWLAVRDGVRVAGLDELRAFAETIAIETDFSRAIMFKYVEIDHALRPTLDAGFGGPQQSLEYFMVRMIRPQLDALFVEAMEVASGMVAPDPHREPPECPLPSGAAGCLLLFAIDTSLFGLSRAEHIEQAAERALRGQKRLKATMALGAATAATRR
ncbi:MAG: hypothetical protein AAF721_05055 [Myxococcota bacterium]